MKDPTLERGHTSAKLVTSGLLRREHYKGMKNCTLDSSHILQITMKLFTCWICQEELSSASQLVNHYDEHMKLP